ncbi:hypothetical protein L195_g028017 [Trifolium pratense]|uniref:Resistance protein n=1 Tax=Trifolium pratense TaxID=57577 RepID=A0A2K3L0S7_TRIPR|nr:hypothetical protein L195_g028017 [Trifolium pratense]
MQQLQQQMQQMQDQHQQYLKNSLARAKNLENQLSQLAQQMPNKQNMEIQTNTQTTPEEKDNILNEESRESVKGVENNDIVDNEVVMMAAEEIEGLLDNEISIEEKRENEKKAEIDWVIDEICALFNMKQLGRIWTPQYLYLKCMELLPNRRKKTDDVLSVSFWPP